MPDSFQDNQILVNNTDVAETDVEVDADSVTLTLPTALQANMEYKVIFNESAGIRNPYYAGNRPIAVSLGGETHELIAVIRRITEIDITEGARGDTFTLTGSGYAMGTVHIFDGNPENFDDQDPDNDPESLVDGGVTTDNGGFEVEVTPRYSPGVLEYNVWTQDSEGVPDGPFNFQITKPTMTFAPATAVIGQPLRITVTDWQNRDAGDPGGIKGVAAVRIAGEDAYTTVAVGYDNCIEYLNRELAGMDRVLSLTVDVPANILRGMKTVSLYDYDQLDITDADGLMVSPSMPCMDVTDRGEPTSRKLTVRLKDNAIPIIQKAIPILAQAPPTVPIAPNIIEVDGGRDQELVLHVYPMPESGNINLAAGDRIEITLPQFNLSGATEEPESIEIGIKGSGGGTIPVMPSRVKVLTGNRLLLTLSAPVLVSQIAGEYLGVTIKADSGILTPEIPRGFDEERTTMMWDTRLTSLS